MFPSCAQSTRRLAALAITVALATALTTALVAPRTLAEGAAPAGPGEEVLARVNEIRATPTECGAEGEQPAAPALALDERLNAAALAHAADMREQGAIDHVGSDGGTVADRLEREGYNWSAAGENVAYGYESVAEVVEGWLESDTHCVNMMRPAFEHLGVGRDGLYWALALAAPL
ncbi:CAP domain-containing protein [soil metagenome]